MPCLESPMQFDMAGIGQTTLFSLCNIVLAELLIHRLSDGNALSLQLGCRHDGQKRARGGTDSGAG